MNGTRHSGSSESTPPHPIRVQRHPQTMPAEPVGAVAQGHGQPEKGEADAPGRVTVIIDASTLMSAGATEPQFCHRHPHPDPPGGGEVIHPALSPVHLRRALSAPEVIHPPAPPLPAEPR